MLVWTVVCGLLGGVAGAGAGDHLYLSHEGWSRAPVTEEDRRRLLGSFVGSSEAAPAVETDPVLGEVFRQPGAGELRPGRQTGGGGDKLLHGFFVTPGPGPGTDTDSEEFSTNFAAADYSEEQVEADTEYPAEYQAEYQAEYPEYQDQHQQQHQHQHQAPHQPPPPPPHVGLGRQTQGRRSKKLII